MKQYEIMETRWERKSTRKNSKWKISWTNGKKYVVISGEGLIKYEVVIFN